MNRLKFIIEESFRSVLNEYAGMFAGCEQLAKNILYIVKNNDWPSIQNGYSRCYEVPCSWAPGGYIAVTVNKNYTKGVNASYIPGFFERYGKFLIAVNPAIKNYKDEDLIPTISHELTHAYEDAMCLRNGENRIHQRIKDTGYNKSLDYATKVGYWDKEEDELGEYKDDVSKFMMTAMSFERNARMAAMYSDIMNAKKEFKTPDDIALYFDDSRVGCDLKFLKGFTEDILAEKNAEEQQNWLKAFSQLSNIKFKDYKHLKRYVKHQFDKFEGKVNEILPKVIYEYFRRKNQQTVSRSNRHINMRTSRW